ncbi:hypothetical protein LCGC14_3161240, partial [marine sediment metagenome]
GGAPLETSVLTAMAGSQVAGRIICKMTMDILLAL